MIKAKEVKIVKEVMACDVSPVAMFMLGGVTLAFVACASFFKNMLGGASLCVFFLSCQTSLRLFIPVRLFF